MAIDFKEFEKINMSNTKNKILEFLKKDKDKAFEYKELASLLNESERTVNAYLSILKNEGKVLHKQPYWAYNRNYSEKLPSASEEVGPKVVPSMFRYEGNGIFAFINNPKIKLNLYGSIRSVKTELNKYGLVSQNIVGFYYLLRKKAGLLNKRIYESNMDNYENFERNKGYRDTSPVRSTSLREALITLLNSEDRIFDLQEIYMKIEDFYNVTEYQRDIDLKYPRPRIQHEIRSHLANLVDQKIILNPSRAKYCINRKN